MAIKLGTYIGDGITPRSVTGIGFQPDIVWVASTALAGSRAWCWKLAAWPNPNGSVFASAVFETDKIRAFLADGFEIGNAVQVNELNISYTYLAIKLPHAGIQVGNYVGDGTDPRDIPTSFTPKMVLVAPRNILGTFTIWRTDAFSTGLHAHRLSGNDVEAISIRSMQPSAFRLGSNAQVNGAGTTYDFVAFGTAACTTQFYTGDGTNNRVLPTLPFNDIKWVIISGAMNPPPGALRFGRCRSTEFPDTFSLQVVLGQPATAGQIIRFPGGNSVEISNVMDGNLQNYNAVGQDYQLFALSGGGGPSKIGKRLH